MREEAPSKSKSILSSILPSRSGKKKKEMRRIEYEEEDDEYRGEPVSIVESGSVGTYVPIRQYAHRAAPRDNSNAERSDFRETLYWDAGFRVNPLVPAGITSVEFDQNANNISGQLEISGNRYDRYISHRIKNEVQKLP